MRINNIEWLKKRIGFIRKLGEQTARQEQIIDLIDNEAGLTEQERKLPPRTGNSGKKRLTGTGERTKTGGPKTNRGKKTTTGTQSPALSRGWATDRSRTGRHKNRRAML